MSILERLSASTQRAEYDVALVMAEQAAQLGIKAALIQLAGHYPRVHGIRLLLGELAKVIGGDVDQRIIGFIKNNRSLLSELEDVYLIARCAPKQHSREDAEDLIAIAERIIRLVEEIERGQEH